MAKRFAAVQIPGTNGLRDLPLGSELGSGGEGRVYEVLERDDLVCKILHPERRHSTLPKIMAMISKQNEFVATPAICWPRCLVAESGLPIGYVMPKASGSELQRSVFIPPLLRKTYPSWTRLDLVRLAESILRGVQTLHEKSILLGDVNARNIMVRADSSISLIDCDSFQMGSFVCPVGSLPYLAPELIGLDLKVVRRTMAHENFAIATLIFMVLLPGKPPFSHRGGTDPASNVRKGHFPYPLDEQGSENRPDGQWRYCWSHLPRYVKEAFYEAFGRDSTTASRPSVRKWLEEMRRYRSDLGKGYVSDVIFPTDYKPKVDPIVQERVQERRRRKKATFASLQEGQEVEGVVRELEDYGAKVDVGGVGGLVHISEMAPRWIRHPSDVVAVGDRVRVRILSVDRERNRLYLGMKGAGHQATRRSSAKG